MKTRRGKRSEVFFNLFLKKNILYSIFLSCGDIEEWSVFIMILGILAFNCDEEMVEYSA